jgi:hypothetical protein
MVPNNLYYSYLHYSIIIFNGSHCQQSILGDRTWNRNSIPTAATRAQPAPSAVKQSAIAGRVCNWGKNVITRNARGKFNFGRLHVSHRVRPMSPAARRAAKASRGNPPGTPCSPKHQARGLTVSMPGWPPYVFSTFNISLAAFAPDPPVNPAPGCVPDPHR